MVVLKLILEFHLLSNTQLLILLSIKSRMFRPEGLSQLCTNT